MRTMLTTSQSPQPPEFIPPSLIAPAFIPPSFARRPAPPVVKLHLGQSNVQTLRARLYAQFEPPPLLNLAEWADDRIDLPSGMKARPGKYRTWPQFRAILESMGDPDVPEVSVMKSVRSGYTTTAVIALGGSVALHPGDPIGLLVPTDDDARDMVTEHIEPVFSASEDLRGKAITGRRAGRNTMKYQRYVGGSSLRVLAARSPRNLRRHDLKILLGDEIDSMEITREGDPIKLARMRTFAHADRKIILGSTPTEEDISAIERAYLASDQRIYELCCPNCDDWFELLWEHIQWPAGEPHKATCFCPQCGGEVEERLKPRLVENGRWRATHPEVVGHHGYRFNALISLLPNASWGQLAADWVAAVKGGPHEQQVFVNTILGRTWKTTLGRTSAEELATRIEPISLETIPPEIVLLTAGVDVQDDRLEVVVLGHPLAGAPAILGRAVISGDTLEDETWRSLDEFLRQRWRHPYGWEMKIDAAAIDSGGSEGRTEKVYNFCARRLARRIFAIKGVAGAQPMWKAANRAKGTSGVRLFLIGADTTKTEVMGLLGAEPFIGSDRNPHSMRFSDDLEVDFFEQLTNEVRRVKYQRNRPVVTFEPKARGKRTEAFDCLCYAWAVRQSPAVKAIDIRARAARRPTPPTDAASAPPPSRFTSWAQSFNS